MTPEQAKLLCNVFTDTMKFENEATKKVIRAIPEDKKSYKPELKSKSAEEKEQDAIRDKAYRESLKKIPDAKASNDPWGGVRSADAPKPATAAKPKAKTGTTAN